MDAEVVLRYVNADAVDFLNKIDLAKRNRLEAKIDGKDYVFIKNRIRGGVEVLCQGLQIHLDFDKVKKIWVVIPWR